MHGLAILVAAAAAAPTPLHAPPAPPAPAPPKPPTVDEVVSRHAEARGGAQKLAALQNLRVSGKVVFGDQDFAINAQFAQLRKRPSSIRTEVTFQGLTAIDAFDGQQSWSVDPFQGRKD